MNTINIYGQFVINDDAQIIGNREGLIALRKAIDATLSCISENTACRIDTFASDGEGYMLSVSCLDEASRFPAPFYIGN